MSEEYPIEIDESENGGEENYTDLNSEDLKTLDEKNWLNDKVSTCHFH